MKSKLQLNEDSTISAQYIYQLCEFPRGSSPATTTTTRRKKMSYYFLQERLLLRQKIRWWWWSRIRERDTWDKVYGKVASVAVYAVMRYLPAILVSSWRHTTRRSHHQLFIMLVMSRLRNNKFQCNVWRVLKILLVNRGPPTTRHNLHRMPIINRNHHPHNIIWPTNDMTCRGKYKSDSQLVVRSCNHINTGSDDHRQAFPFSSSQPPDQEKKKKKIFRSSYKIHCTFMTLLAYYTLLQINSTYVHLRGRLLVASSIVSNGFVFAD